MAAMQALAQIDKGAFEYAALPDLKDIALRLC
jgi:hypothetical protein